MTDSRNQAVLDLERLVAAVDELQGGLKAAKAHYQKALRSLRRGDPVQSALAVGASASTRETTTAMLEQFERDRLASRMSLIAAGVDEGMSINTVSKAWGISRQLASRYVNRVRPGEETG
jgi:hypothetical protein